MILRQRLAPSLVDLLHQVAATVRAALAARIQKATGDSVEVAFVDQGDTGEQAAADAEAHGIRLEVVKLPTAERGVCAAASALGRGAQLCVAGPLPAAGPGL